MYLYNQFQIQRSAGKPLALPQSTPHTPHPKTQWNTGTTFSGTLTRNSHPHAHTTRTPAPPLEFTILHSHRARAQWFQQSLLVLGLIREHSLRETRFFTRVLYNSCATAPELFYQCSARETRFPLDRSGLELAPVARETRLERLELFTTVFTSAGETINRCCGDSHKFPTAFDDSRFFPQVRSPDVAVLQSSTSSSSGQHR